MSTLQPKRKPKVAEADSRTHIQRIHYKYVPNPKDLLQELNQRYGSGNYSVEVRFFRQVRLYIQDSSH
jgi:hypothetical protein